MRDWLKLAAESSAARVFNILLFQIGWFSCVLLSTTSAVVITATILCLHQLFLARPGEYYLIAAIAAVGILIDSLLVRLAILNFPTQSVAIPIWLMCLWFLFGSTICHGLSWLRQRLMLAAALSAFAGPVSYLAGAKLAEVSLAEPIWLSVLVLSAIWLVITPVALLASRYVVHA